MQHTNFFGNRVVGYHTIITEYTRMTAAPFSCHRLTRVSGMTQEQTPAFLLQSIHVLITNVQSHKHIHRTAIQMIHLCVCACCIIHQSFSPADYHSLIHQTHLFSISLHPHHQPLRKGVALINYSVLAFRNLSPCEHKTPI